LSRRSRSVGFALPAGGDGGGDDATGSVRAAAVALGGAGFGAAAGFGGGAGGGFDADDGEPGAGGCDFVDDGPTLGDGEPLQCAAIASTIAPTITSTSTTPLRTIQVCGIGSLSSRSETAQTHGTRISGPRA
jgi:hypothetical protein